MKKVLITGGSDGLGKAIAKSLVTEGYEVTILSRDEAKTKKAASELGCSYAVADVRDAKALEKAIAQAGDVDILVNNAGVWIQNALEENPIEAIKEVMDVNALGTIYATRAVVPGMKKRGGGRIINVISQAGLYAKGERSVYNASKWAVTGFTKSMQQELNLHKIAVTGLYPGSIDTDLFEKAGSYRRNNALETATVAGSIVYICGLPDSVNVPEIGMYNL